MGADLKSHLGGPFWEGTVGVVFFFFLGGGRLMGVLGGCSMFFWIKWFLMFFFRGFDIHLLLYGCSVVFLCLL